MSDEDFIRSENEFKDALEKFKQICEEYGVDAFERIQDCIDFD